MADDPKAQISPEELWAAMRRDSEGMRQLQQYLDEIKDLDDVAFAEAIGGVDRAETTDLLERLNHVLAELDKVAAQIHPDAD